MAEIVNLRSKRKEAARKSARQSADVNAMKFGRTKGQKAVETAEAEAARRHLDQHRRSEEKPDGEA